MTLEPVNKHLHVANRMETLLNSLSIYGNYTPSLGNVCAQGKSTMVMTESFQTMENKKKQQQQQKK